MSTRSGPGRGRSDPGRSAVNDAVNDAVNSAVNNAVMGERRQLINLAYRLLGSLAEAEDAVQEAYARWYALSPRERDAIASPGAWLTTVASRVCLNLLTSARVRRETYVGEWIPEPLPERGEWIGRAGGTAVDPADRVTATDDMMFLERTVNGQPGLVALDGGVTVTVFAFEIAGDRIKRIWVIRNPEKLRRWAGR